MIVNLITVTQTRQSSMTQNKRKLSVKKMKLVNTEAERQRAKVFNDGSCMIAVKVASPSAIKAY